MDIIMKFMIKMIRKWIKNGWPKVKNEVLISMKLRCLNMKQNNLKLYLSMPILNVILWSFRISKIIHLKLSLS
jgi:hypothetical protein